MFTGNDYEGGAGNDTLNGTYGTDTYRFNLGDGTDTIIEPGLTPGTSSHGQVDQGADTLVFGSGIAAADIAVKRMGNDLELTHSNGTDKVTVKDWFAAVNSGKQLAAVQFTDGTSWTTAQLSSMGCTVVGSEAADTLTGATLYANTLEGAGGNDTLIGGTVADVLSGGAGDDSLIGGDGADTLLGGDGNDVHDGGAGIDVFKGGAGDDVLGGTSGFERFGTVAGTDRWSWSNTPPLFVGNDYEGGTGNDTLNGTYGTDTYRFNLGDGTDTIIEPGLTPGTSSHGQVDQGADVLVFGSGIAAADIAVQRVGNDLVLAHTNGADKVTVKDWYAAVNSGKQLAAVQFADATVWTTAQLSAMGCTVVGSEAADTLTGATLYANTLNGGWGNDVIAGGTVGDVLSGGVGDDTLAGDAGADTLLGGDGNDVLDGGAGIDVLKGGAGDDVLGSTSTFERFDSTTGTDRWSWSNNPSMFTGNDYEGGAGNDTLNGTYGTDTYHFNLGDGADTIIEPGLTPGTSSHGQVDQGADVLVFGSGIAAADIAVQRVGNDLELVHANGADKVTVKDWYAAVNSGKQLAAVQFADGTVWATEFLSAQGNAIRGTMGDDTLMAPADMWARSLFGDGGNDVLAGNTASNWLVGGTGNDALFGGAGNDIYNWTVGDGYDTLTDTAGTDTIDFSAIDVAMAQFFKCGNDLEINTGDTTSGILVKNQLLTTGPAIEQFKFADAMLSASEVQSMAILRL